MIYIITYCSFPWWLAWLLPALLGLLAGWALMSKWKKRFGDMEAKYNALVKTNGGLEADLKACNHDKAMLDGDIATANGMVKEMKAKVADSEAALAAAVATGTSSLAGSGSSKSGKGKSGKSNDNSGGKEKGSGKGKANDTSDSSSGAGARGDSSSGSGPESGGDSGSDASVSGADLGNIVSGFAGGAVAGNLGGSGEASDSGGDDGSGGDSGSKGASSSASTGGDSGVDAAYGALKSDNLQIIEGIGPKMESVLKDAGVNSWSALSTKSADDLRAILDKHGDKYKIINPTSWSEQANLAAGGKWNELILLQKQLDGGTDSNIDMTDSKLEKLMAKNVKSGFGKFKQDDLKLVEGIGPKIAELLNNGGINTWAELAASTPDKIQGILDAAGSKFKLAKPGSWPEQAGHAAAGRWTELKDLQDKLDGGV